MKLHLRFALLLAPLLSIGCAHAQSPIHLEAEDAQLTGATIETKRPGFTGKSYVSGFTKGGDKIVWTVPSAHAGIYEARVHYASPTGPKGFDLVVNGHKSSAMFPATGDAFGTVTAGKVELQDGQNTVAIEKGWGWYDVDAVDLVPAKLDGPLAMPPATLTDAKATPEARALVRYLANQYGSKTLSGQYEEADNAFVRDTVKQMPAIRGGDLIEYSPTRVANGSKPDGTTEKLIAAARAGQILTLSWHWNAPSHLINGTIIRDGKPVEELWWRGFYTDASTFDLEKTLADPNGADYKLLLSDIDTIAIQLQKLSDAHIPVLWRPLHEAQGGWFWWGAKGPKPFKALWRLMYDRITKTHDIHNLVWVFTAGDNHDWYPGDDVVDIVGADAYPSDVTDPLSATWDDLNAQFGGKKLIALSEFGKVPEVERMRKFGVRWSYFVSWSGDLGAKAVAAPELNRLYTLPTVVNQGALPGGISAGTAAAPAAPHPISTEKQTAPLVQLVALAVDPKPLAPRPMAPTRANYMAIGAQVEANLRSQVLGEWFPRAVSTQFGGGFDQNFDEGWKNTSKGERSVVYQARLTWLASQAAQRFPNEAAKWRGFASHGADYLRTRMWDAQNGGFYWEIDGGVPARGGEKHVYGNSFAIYALAAHYRATHDPRSLDLAKRAFFWLETHAHDARNGGYYEALTRAGRPILTAVSPAQTSDCIGTHYGLKTMNTHIHLLEAFAALSEVWPDKTLHARLNELFYLVRDRIVVSPPGAMNLYFQPDWKAVPDHDSFGHDIETAYLLVEAAKVLGHENDARTWTVARSLVDHTLDFGLDATNGGVFDAGGVFGPISGDDKIWWTQAETLNALLLMHEHFGAQTPRYWNAFVAQWNFIQRHQVDAKNGGWLRRVSKTNTPFAGESKSDGWTECYHQGRALLNVSAALGHLSANSKR